MCLASLSVCECLMHAVQFCAHSLIDRVLTSLFEGGWAAFKAKRGSMRC